MNKILKMNHRDREILLSTPLVAGLSGAALNRILEIVVVSGHEARDMIFREGTAAENMFVVLAGYVRLFRAGKDGREADIGIFSPGEVFGECLILLDSVHAFNAQAAESVTLARIDIAKARQIMLAEPEFAIAIMNILSRHLREVRENVANDRLHTAPQRVANYLLELAGTRGANASTMFRLPFQKSLLAGKLGLAPEALSRAFSTLKNVGVSIRGRMVQIDDMETLRKF